MLLGPTGCLLSEAIFPSLENVTDLHKNRHRKLGKMRRHRSTFQMKGRGKKTKQNRKTKQSRVNNLLDKEFKVKIIKMLNELGR